MATTLGKIITMNWMTGTEKPAKILLPTTEIGGSVKYLMGIANPFRTEIANQTDPTIQPTVTHFNQLIGMLHSYWNHFCLGSLDSGTDVPRSKRNIDNHTGMNPHEIIITTISVSNRSNN